MKQYYETGFRLKRDQKEALRRKGLHVYSRRDNGRENTIEPSVAVDFMGTIVTNFPIEFPESGPSANTIYQGDTYLRQVKASPVRSIEDLQVQKPKRKKASQTSRLKQSQAAHIRLWRKTIGKKGKNDSLNHSYHAKAVSDQSKKGRILTKKEKKSIYSRLKRK